ncbi:MAG TPA: sigma-70 family RNA polymerase sigma factor [Saprospiraceae bacterium]|nr:sigma-70 family RNA polymerase sigma factor [Saprospiraceae bacterium]HPI05224.1 sigma-70 family RNA polymerase sigma factor [Saprospiraceae bacterium]
MTNDPAPSELLQLVQQHAGILHKIIRLYADDAEDRRDLYQEMLYETWRAYPGFRGASAFSTWLYRVALNTALTFRKKTLRKVNLVGLDAAGQVPGEGIPALSPAAELLYRAIRQLPETDRAIISLHLDSYDNEEIAAISGMTKNHVAVKLHRIKTELENRLKRG